MDEWRIYKKISLQETISLLLQKVVKGIPKDFSSFGGFSPIDKTFDRQHDKYLMPTWLEKGQSINIEYLKKIITLCYQENIKLIFIYMPVFHPEDFYDQNNFYQFYNQLFSEIQLLDYSKWEIPDNYRADEHHLNRKGANLFTMTLQEDLRIR